MAAARCAVRVMLLDTERIVERPSTAAAALRLDAAATLPALAPPLPPAPNPAPPVPSGHLLYSTYPTPCAAPSRLYKTGHETHRL